MGVCTTRHGQTTNRQVQEFNVCTVYKGQLVRILVKENAANSMSIDTILNQPPSKLDLGKVHTHL